MPESEGRLWYVALSKPRKESLAIRELERQGYECYAPRLKEERILRGKAKMVEVPLFPRYLFLRPRGPDPARLASVRSTYGVSHLVTFGPDKTPGTIDAALIEHLKREEVSRLAGPLPEPFQKGDPVRVLEGPFKGITGIFDLREGEARVHVLIQLIGSSARLPVARSSLEKVGR